MGTDIRPTPIRTAGEKFIELRLKTDRDLKFLVEKALNRAYQVLGSGEREQAERTYARAAALLSLIRTPPLRRREASAKSGANFSRLARLTPWRP